MRLKLNPLRETSRASGSSSSTTRSCAAPRPARSSRCCARPARPRCTSGSRRRRTGGRASTGSTPASAPICSRPTCRSARSPTISSVDSLAYLELDRLAPPPARRPRRSAPPASPASTRCRSRASTTRSSCSSHRRLGRRTLAPGRRPVLGVSRRRAGAPRLTYAEAGVDIAAGEKAVELIKDARPLDVPARGDRRHRRVRRPVRHGTGSGYQRPVLVSSTDGVGTKSVLARELGRYDTIGIDCVAMSVDDIAAHGARAAVLPRLHLGRHSSSPTRSTTSWPGWPTGAARRGCALLGGEMSEHPGVMEPGEFDLVGFAVGVVERGGAAAPPTSRAGDRIIGIASPGLRCNGYSLARQRCSQRAGLRPRRSRRGAAPHHSLGAELLRPSVIYAPALLDLRRRGRGARGLRTSPAAASPATWSASCPSGCDALVDARRVGRAPDLRRDPGVRRRRRRRDGARVQPRGGDAGDPPPHDGHRALDTLRAGGHEAWRIGEITAGNGRVVISHDRR